MAENIIVPENSSKSEIYRSLMPQIRALTENEANLVANLANIAAALKQSRSFFWVGFYLVDQGELVLGPFQGPVACTRIQYGKGVCGTAWKDKKSQLVPDVDQFPGHIACSSLSKSEIVVPVIKEGQVVMVLDIDSSQLNDFDQHDIEFAEQLADYISEKLL